jgi:glycosyltransferase involved in cell wall biosynthesis
MKVLFLMFAFPDMNKSFNMYTALVDMFNQNGHEVTVVAPSNSESETGICIEYGVEVLRVKTLYIKNVSNIKKGIANILIPYQYEKALKYFYNNRTFDLIILPTPPITLGTLAAKLKKKHNAKVYLILRDIFPQNAVDLDFMKKNSPIHQFFRHKETKLYACADKIGCMSQANIDYIVKMESVDEKKLHILKNWQYLNLEPEIDVKSITDKYNISDKFVIIFGGNMGKPQQLENVIELAIHCNNHHDIVFMLIGEGVMMEKIKVIAKQKNINNIRFHESIPKMEYQSLLKAAQVGLISLHQNFTIPNIPSKALDYWNVGLPILGSIDKATDFGALLDATQSGLWTLAGNHQVLYEKLMQLYRGKELRRQMSKNGKDYFIKNLTPEIAYNTIIVNL